MNQIQSFLERPKTYYNIDGVGELGMGFMCLGFSLLAWLQLHTPSTAVWHRMYTFVIYVAVMCSTIRYGSKAIKNHVTYRRTGFVEYRKRDRVWVAVAAFIFSALVGFGLMVAVRRHWVISVPGSFVGLLLAAGYVRIAKTNAWKWAVFAAMVAGALVIGALPPDLVEAFANGSSLNSAIPAKVVGAYWLTFVVYGALLMISGAISFWLYVRDTQPPAQECE